jgi:hypothetical protein
VRTRLTRLTGAAAVGLGKAVRSLPGVAALGCAVTGTAILWGTGWAFLAAVPFLLILARELN